MIDRLFKLPQSSASSQPRPGRILGRVWLSLKKQVKNSIVAWFKTSEKTDEAGRTTIEQLSIKNEDLSISSNQLMTSLGLEYRSEEQRMNEQDTQEDTMPSSLNLNSSQPNADDLSWEQSLELWVNNAPEGELTDRQDAANRIKSCYTTGSKDLSFESLHITSLLGVVFPPSLETLDLSNTQITSLLGVVFPPRLKWLDLSSTQITSLEGVVFPPYLWFLNLSNNPISSLLGLVFPPNLETLLLRYIQITSLVGVVFPPNLQSFDLSCTQITSLVGVVFPPNLQSLDLSCTQITSLVGVVFPPNLQSLDLSYTQITSLVGVVFPPNLLLLYLRSTQITSLVGVVFPPNLLELNLRNTQITSLVGVVFPPNLQWLDLRNTRINSLPENLAQYSARLRIYTTNCRLNAAANEAFQNAIDRARDQNPDQGPQWETSVYEENLSRDATPSFLNLNSFQVPDLHFNDDQKNLFNQFLIKVQGTKDFQNGRTSPNLILALKEILQATTSSSTFKENLFPLINESLDSCSDRTAITLNRIDLQRRIDCGGINPELLIGYRRLQLVQEAASKFIQQKRLGDAIEPMLYLQIKLKEDLNLPILTSSMLYEGLANITDEELDQTKKDILSKTTTGEQILYLLTENQEESYDDNGSLKAVGDLSPTNPFLADISKIWEKQLKRAFSIDFERIEPRDDEDTTDLSVIQKWDNRMKELVRDLTQQILY